MRLSIEQWKQLCADKVREEFADISWPNGIGLGYEEAADYAEEIAGQGPVICDFDEDDFYDCLGELEEDIAEANGEEKVLDW